MNRNIAVVVFAVVIAGATIAAYFYWRHLESQPEVVALPPPPPVVAAPEVRQTVEAPPQAPPLPKLAESDRFMHDELVNLVGNTWVVRVFRTDRIIHYIVATIDNLPTQHAPMEVMPIVPATGLFITVEKDGELFISPKNTERYAPYMRVVELADTKKLVGLYVRLYPLFQQAYEELGYPHKYFNDRLGEVIDDLLEAPDIKEPIKVIQPKVMYLFADPELEDLSIGQRIMIRVGSKNEAILKAKLHAIKQELSQHLHETPVGAPEKAAAPAAGSPH